MRKVIATKFVAWEVPPLESLQNTSLYRLRVKLNNGGKLNREEKDWLTRQINDAHFFNDSVPWRGWRFNFSDVLRTFIVNRYGDWFEYKAVDKTAVRRALRCRINRIIELDSPANRHIRHVKKSIKA